MLRPPKLIIPQPIIVIVARFDVVQVDRSIQPLVISTKPVSIPVIKSGDKPIRLKTNSNGMISISIIWKLNNTSITMEHMAM